MIHFINQNKIEYIIKTKRETKPKQNKTDNGKGNYKITKNKQNNNGETKRRNKEVKHVETKQNKDNTSKLIHKQ